MIDKNQPTQYLSTYSQQNQTQVHNYQSNQSVHSQNNSDSDTNAGNTNPPEDKIQKVLKYFKYLIIFKLIVMVVYSFVGFGSPHITRQAVTMAVNQRFSIDWKFHDKQFPFLPRSLAGGDHDAILDMEFPLLNYLTLPPFYFDIETARPLARLIFIFLMLGFWFWHYRVWKPIKILGISGEWPSLLLIVMPISGVYMHRFMPDFFSFILCSLALGYSIRYPEKMMPPLLLATLGLLEKPTAIISFGPLLLLEHPIREVIRRLKWLLPSLLVMLGYYVGVARWVRSITDLEPYYMTNFRNPLWAFQDFFKLPSKVFEFFMEMVISPYLPLVFFGYGIFYFWKNKKWPPLNRTTLSLLGLLIVQLLTIILMDGGHALIHPYYFVGMSLTAAYLLVYILQNFIHSKILIFLILLPLFFWNIERSFYELRDYFLPRPQSTQMFWKNCSMLKSRHPDWPWNQGYSFRSKNTPISELGLCFGEIQSSQKNEFGFFMDDEPIPSDCRKVDQEGTVVLVQCESENTKI